MKNDIILSRAYPDRMESVETLILAADERLNRAEQLRACANKLDGTALSYGRASTAEVYAAFAELLRVAAQLVEWRHAVLDAQAEAERFLTAAKAKYRFWQREYAEKGSMATLVAASQVIESINYVDEIAAVCLRLASMPLPIGVYANPILSRRRLQDDVIEGEAKEIPDELAVAFIRFQIDSRSVVETHYLTPNEVHDLEIEVRVSRWAVGATHLALSPVSIELASTYDLPTFEFPKPEGTAPFTLRATGRAVLKVAQGISARPYEFKYSAEFKPAQAEKPAVVGHRTLRIESYDLARNPMTGYLAIDKKLVLIRDNLRTKLSYIPVSDINNLFVVLKPLSNLAGRSIQDALFRGVQNERSFQVEVRAELRRDPTIGSELEEHANAAGGETDLSYRGIRIELKYSDDKALSTDECAAKFTGQTTAYVVGTGKRVGVLCVLDNSAKREAAFPAEEGIKLHSVQTAEGTIEVAVLLIQGGIPRPSALSR